MSDTNPTAAAAAIQILSNAGLSPATAGMLARRIVSAARREVLAEGRTSATRAIHALKSPAPAGSQHYRAGWDDGLDAAIDAARNALEAGESRG